MLSDEEGNLFIVVETTSIQSFSGILAWNNKVKVVSITCLCFLFVNPFCSGVPGKIIIVLFHIEPNGQ